MAHKVTLLKAGAEFKHLTVEPAEFPHPIGLLPGAPKANVIAERFCSG